MGDESTWESAVTEISFSSLIYTGSTVLNNIWGVALTLVATNLLTNGQYGIYSYVSTIFVVVSLLAPFGADESLLRFLPEATGNQQRENEIISLSLFTSLFGGGMLSVFLFISAPTISSHTIGSPLFVFTLRIFALAIPIRSVTKVLVSIFRSKKNIRLQVLVQHFFRPAAKFILISTALVLGYELFGLAATFFVSTALTLFFAIYLSQKYFTIEDISFPLKERVHGYYNFSIPIGLRNIGSVVYTKTDILMLGLFVSADKVGYYNVAVLVATFLVIPLTGLNQIFPAFASELYHAGNHHKLLDTHSTLIRISFSATLLLVSISVVYHNTILSLFGRGFTTVSMSLIILSIGRAIDALAYGTGNYLSISDNQYILLFNQTLFGGLNIVLNYVSIMNFGVVGAALATTVVITLQNIGRIFECWYIERHFPYRASVLIPVLLVSVSIIIMLCFNLWLNGLVSMVAGVIIGTIVYIVLLYIFMAEDEEKELLLKMIAHS